MDKRRRTGLTRSYAGHMAKVYSRGPHAHKTRIAGAVTRAHKPQKVVTAKKLREQKARTEQIKESRAMRKMLREKPKLRGWLHLIAFPSPWPRRCC